jgi:hypothetical protein
MNKSLQDLMNEAYNLSLDLSFKTITWQGNYFDPRESFPLGGDSDKIFGWSDGLFHKYYQKISNGECSLAQTIDFDLERFEQSVISDIEEFNHLIKIYGKPLILSKEHLRALGYRGEMAGYTKEEEHRFSISHYQNIIDNSKKELLNIKDYDTQYQLQSEINHCEKRLNELCAA